MLLVNIRNNWQLINFDLLVLAKISIIQELFMQQYFLLDTEKVSVKCLFRVLIVIGIVSFID